MEMFKARNLSKLEKIISENKDFTTNGEILFCKLCKKEVSFQKMFFVSQHTQSKKHSMLKAKEVEAKDFDPENVSGLTQNNFAKDLCELMVSIDMPLYKLRNPRFVNFIQKYTNFTAPSETNVRESHLISIYNETIDFIREEIKNQYIWIAIDETIDAVGRYIANAVVGILSCDLTLAKKRFLVNTSQLERADATCIANFFDKSLKVLGEDFDRDKVLLFVSDAAPYMKKAAKAIQTFLPKITHVTCIAHALHRVCEEIRSHFEDINVLISSVKKTFIKCPSRVQIFKTHVPGVELPPEPVTTRWGTWLKAVDYYAKNFQAIVDVFENFCEDEAAAIKQAKEVLEKETLKADLVKIFFPNFLS